MDELIPSDQEWDASKLDGGVKERIAEHQKMSEKTKNVPDATSCNNVYTCPTENQYCPPHAPGSSGVGFRCCRGAEGLKWTP